jgi:hypothetical protein
MRKYESDGNGSPEGTLRLTLSIRPPSTRISIQWNAPSAPGTAPRMRLKNVTALCDIPTIL